MNTDPRSIAGKRYIGRFIPLMLGYVVALFGVTWLFNTSPPEGVLRYLAAALPALPAVGVIWAVGMYLREEQDEYLRMKLATTSLWATGLTLAAATVWGFLEQFDTVEHIPLYYAFVFYWGAFGLTQIVQKVFGK